jgi:hypothetical protein
MTQNGSLGSPDLPLAASVVVGKTWVITTGRISMKRITTIALASAAVLFACAAQAQAPDFSKVEIKATDLGKNTSILEGQDGNITVAEAWRDAGSSPAAATRPPFREERHRQRI